MNKAKMTFERNPIRLCANAIFCVCCKESFIFVGEGGEFSMKRGGFSKGINNH